MNNTTFGKTLENVRKCEILNLSQQKEEGIIQYQNQRIEMTKREMIMNKLVYLGLSILELSNILMYEFWYNYVKLKNGENVKLCYMNTDSFIVYIKTDDNYKGIAEDVETRFDTSNYELE